MIDGGERCCGMVDGGDECVRDRDVLFVVIITGYPSIFSLPLYKKRGGNNDGVFISLSYRFNCSIEGGVFGGVKNVDGVCGGGGG